MSTTSSVTPESSIPGFQPNFFSNHSVVLDHPISNVFSTIGTSVGHERVTRLSGMCSGFKLLELETVVIPQSSSLAETHVRTLPSSVLLSESLNAETTARALPRQQFTLEETVPVFFGLMNTHVSLSGTLSWDDVEKLALYESTTQSGIPITVWKLRRFEEVEGNKTKVTECIQGRCPRWIRRIVQNQTSAGHIAHMGLYNTLF